MLSGLQNLIYFYHVLVPRAKTTIFDCEMTACKCDSVSVHVLLLTENPWNTGKNLPASSLVSLNLQNTTKFSFTPILQASNKT